MISYRAPLIGTAGARHAFLRNVGENDKIIARHITPIERGGHGGCGGGRRGLKTLSRLSSSIPKEEGLLTFPALRRPLISASTREKQARTRHVANGLPRRRIKMSSGKCTDVDFLFDRRSSQQTSSTCSFPGTYRRVPAERGLYYKRGFYYGYILWTSYIPSDRGLTGVGLG